MFDRFLPAAVRDLVGIAAFRRLLLAQIVSETGDWLTNVALVLLLYRLLDHPGAAALVLLTKLAPRALLYPIGGLLADRFDRRRLMIVADLVRAGLAASLLLVQSVEGLWWALLATVLAQGLASLFNPAAKALLPTLAPTARLGAANALLGGAMQVVFFLAPMLGALLIAVGGTGLAFLVDAATFVISAALLAGLAPAARPAAERPALDVRRDLALGWTVVRQQPAVAGLFVAQVLFGTLIAALNVLLVPLLVAHWQAAAEWLGALYAAVGAGCLLGAALALRLAPVHYPRATLLALGVMGVATLGLGLAPWLALGLGLLVLAGVATMVGDVASVSLIQGSVADERQGRVFGLLFWVIALGQVVGAGLGWAAGTLSPTLLVGGLGLVALVAALLLGLSRRAAAGAPAALASAPPTA